MNRQTSLRLKTIFVASRKWSKLTQTQCVPFQDVGQMDTYIRIYDQHRKSDDDNPAIGLVPCSQKNEAVVKYSLLTDNQQLFASKYLPSLPTEEELKRELERERALVERQSKENRGLYAA